jgi:cell division protein FtsW
MTSQALSMLDLKQSARRFVVTGIDSQLIFTLMAIVSLGLIMVASASVSFAYQTYGDGHFFIRRHLIYLVLSLVVALVVLQVPVRFWFKGSNAFIVFAIGLLLVVLIPGIGREVNGARRWIGLGIINLQVAEIAKLAAIVFIAGYLHRHQSLIREKWHSFVRPLSMIGAIVLLLMAQPDFGSAVVIMATVMALFFLGGVKLWVFMGLAAGAIGSLALLAVTSPYRMKRLVSFLDPWEDQFDTGYQLVQSLIAFGRGEWFGVGLGNSVQKLLYLPEAHTDFVFAIYAEETGLFGVVVVIGLFCYLVHRIFAVARLAVKRQDWFAAYLVFGVGVLIAGQAFINIGVTSGLLPTKGLTLPFISYGGSSLLVCSAMMAMVLRVGAEMDDEFWQGRKGQLSSSAAEGVDHV